MRYVKPVMDVIVTLLLWVYFILGFFFFFAPFYAAAALRRRDREAAFQGLNHWFFEWFFRLLCLIAPGVTLNIAPGVRSVRSSIIICNHLSYLDSILLVSLFAKQKTIVRSDLFSAPVFGWIMKQSGYIPSKTGGKNTTLLLRNMETVREFLAAGGNLFIFPEGTRSRTGRLGPFYKGAFSIARYCRAPVVSLLIRETNRLFVPGRFWFNTCVPVAIGVEKIGTFVPDYGDENFRLTALIAEIRALYEDRLKEAS